MVSRFFACPETQILEGSPLGMSSPSSPSLSTRAFLLTISTKNDISPECIASLKKHIKNTTVHAYVVTEHGSTGKLHLHAVLIYKDSRLSKKLHENLWDRYVKPHHPESIGSVAVKVQVCPGHDWYDTYLQKEQDSTVVLDTYSREEVTPYFPDATVQQALLELHQAKGKKSCNEWWDKHVQAWSDTSFTDTPDGALCYFKSCWLDGSTARVTDPRRSTQLARGLYEHRHKIVTCTERELFLLKQLEEGPSYEVPGSIRGEHSTVPPSI